MSEINKERTKKNSRKLRESKKEKNCTKKRKKLPERREKFKGEERNCTEFFRCWFFSRPIEY